MGDGGGCLCFLPQQPSAARELWAGQQNGSGEATWEDTHAGHGLDSQPARPGPDTPLACYVQATGRLRGRAAHALGLAQLGCGRALSCWRRPAPRAVHGLGFLCALRSTEGAGPQPGDPPWHF